MKQDREQRGDRFCAEMDELIVHDPDGNRIAPEPKRTKRLVRVTSPEAVSTEIVARFYLEEDGTVTAEWEDADLREHFEVYGIVSSAGVHFPSDGERFFAALSIAFSSSNLMYAEEVGERAN